MKRSLKVFVVLAVSVTALTTTSCEKFLDVNDNPNNILSATPQAILPQALKVTGDNLAAYNSYGNWVAGYWGKSGIVNGFSDERTYNYTSAYQAGLWTGTYDNIKDYDLIEKAGIASGQANIAAIGTIMKVYNYQLLVDQYGDIPYTQALQGVANVVPKYDKAEDIYKDLLVKLNDATAAIKALPATARPVGSEDIVFGGNMANWNRFANTLKLRILMRQSKVNRSYAMAEIAKLPATNADYLTTTAQAQPGYLQVLGQQNPFFNTFGLTPTGGSTVNRNYVQPTQYIIDQYQNNKDPRLARLYTAATDPTVAGKYLGVTLGDPNVKGVALYSRNRVGGGLLKAYDQPSPIILASESYFLQSEAKLQGFMAGGPAAAKTDYLAGIKASFVYFYTPAPSQVSTTANVSANATPDYDKYIADNLTNKVVSWDAATTTIEHEEQIIFQKYLASNSVASIEAWNEYRRTGFPKIRASVESISPRADKLPVRLLYPQSEIATNLANVPTGISQFTSKIFWDVVD